MIQGTKDSGKKQMKTEVSGFEGLVVGRTNALAVAVAKEVVAGPVRKRSNPFVVVGKCGYGKTALLNAIASGIAARNDGRKAVQVSSDYLLQEYLKALHEDTVQTFVHQYQTADILIIDQLELLKAASVFADELRTIVDYRIAHKKQLVVASAVALDAFATEERSAALAERLNSGVVIQIGKPDKQMRMTAIERELRESGYEFPTAVAEAIAEAGSRNMWLTGGMLHRVMFAHEVMGQTAFQAKNLQKVLGQ